MLSISLGPVALPVAPMLLLLAVWGASWLASRMASSGADKGHPTAAGNAVLDAALIGLLAARLGHLGLNADLYVATPWAALDVRDGGWHVPTGAVAGAAWLAWRGFRMPALRRPLAVASLAGMVFWIAASTAANLGQARGLPALGFTELNGAANVNLPRRTRPPGGRQSVGQLVWPLPAGDAGAGGGAAA
jgi:hypothetical protein